MKGYKNILLIVLATTLFFGCSGDEQGNNEKAPTDSKLNANASDNREKSITTGPQIVCDKFELITNIAGSELNLSIDTDLPDNAIVMVSVSRLYLQKDNSETHSMNYFSEKSTIGKWKSKQRISISNDKLETGLRAQQERMSKLGLGFDVASISDSVTASMVVPINQTDPKFGDKNQNLSGSAVSTGVFRIVKDEIDIYYPLDTSLAGDSPFPSLYPLDLEIGPIYTVSKQTPLMPSHSPDDPISSLQQMIQIPQKGSFKILEVYKEKTNPWYKVNAFDQKSVQIGTGWINSMALLGQELKAQELKAQGQKAQEHGTFQVDSKYIISEEISMMPDPASNNKIELSKEIINLQPHDVIQIAGQSTVNNELWYEVFAHKGDGTYIGYGWINSIELMVQH